METHRVDGTGSVSVCICTFKRPHVGQTVLSVLEQDELWRIPHEIIVCDDDPQESAAPLFEKICAVAPSVRYVVSGAGNVSAARNTCLERARGDFIAFIDDDELAEPTWLSALLRAQTEYGADVVKGRVRGVYPTGTPGWIKRADPFTRDYGPTGSRLRTTATGNVLMRRSLHASDGLAFDPGYGCSGGEDSDFFSRAVAGGAKIISCREAVVDEIVPPYRVDIDYLTDKALRFGEVAGWSSRRGNFTAVQTADEIARALAGISIGWTYPALRPIGDALSYRLMVKFWYSVGMLRGLMGVEARKMA